MPSKLHAYLSFLNQSLVYLLSAYNKCIAGICVKSWEAPMAVIQFFISGQAIMLWVPEDHEDFMQVWQVHVMLHLWQRWFPNASASVRLPTFPIPGQLCTVNMSCSVKQWNQASMLPREKKSFSTRQSSPQLFPNKQTAPFCLKREISWGERERQRPF